MNRLDDAVEAVAVDFEVSLLGRTERSALLWAERHGPSGLFDCFSTVGVWHFVEVSDKGGGPTIRQWHIPRFKLAADCATLERAPEKFGRAAVFPIISQLAQGLSLVMVAPGVIHIAAGGSNSWPMSGAAEDLRRKDLTTLESARTVVHEQAEDDYDLPEPRTPLGGTLRASTADLLAAVAFEWLTMRDMSASDFGIYSAHCTCSDFVNTERMSEELIQGLASGDLGNDVSEGRSSVREWYAEAERRLFGRPTWSHYKDIGADDRAAVLAEAMATLNRTQRVQFVLMNGMLQAGVMMPLSVATGIVTCEQFIDARCEGLQPDSVEEQDVRRVISFIELYGDLAGADPLPDASR